MSPDPFSWQAGGELGPFEAPGGTIGKVCHTRTHFEFGRLEQPGAAVIVTGEHFALP